MIQQIKHTKRTLVLTAILGASNAQALPIGYGYNQGRIEFSEIITPEFDVYYDSRAPDDGRLAFRSLNAAKPHMERWFMTKRSSPLIVNMSAESDNASFANFITDSIELQTLGQGTRDLAWHEYTHATMYQHLDNFFGPAGSILHLPWMEAWFLEGLAEAISVSVGSEQQAGVERYQALHDDFPSWDRIHSLYTSGPFSYRGYATSGAFVSWIMRTYDANRLPEILMKFRDDTMPWWWAWAFVPFNHFWPMDSMLREWTGHSGKELYEEYKAAATDHWRKQTPSPTLVTKQDPYLAITSASSVQVKNNQVYALTEVDDKAVLRPLQFSKDKPFVDQWTGNSIDIGPSKDVWSHSVAVDATARVYVSDHWPKANQKRAAVTYIERNKKRILKRNANWISNVFLTKTHLWWIEYELESTRVCSSARQPKTRTNPQCVYSSKTPVNINFLGTSFDSRDADHPSAIWISATTQTMLGDRHDLLELNLATQKISKHAWTQGGRPLSLAFASTGTWMLVSDRANRYIRHFSTDGKCEASAPTSDLIVRLLNNTESLPTTVLWMGESHAVAKLASKDFKTGACTQLDDHISPMLFAIRSNGEPDLKTSMQGSNPWQVATPASAIDPSSTALDASQSTNGKDKDPEIAETKARWRGRPVFAFPWIGADDALGPQIGIISVPLMDHLQNETVRATVLLGLYSRFPYQELALTENRFTPTWTIAPYRSQVYNGRYFDKKDGELYSSYLDEKGVHIDGDLSQGWKTFAVDWSWGARGGHLAKYIGDAGHVGSYKEVYGAMSTSWRFAGRWKLLAGTQTRIAPNSINEKFDYNVVGASTGLSHPIGDGSIEAGIEGERTRGPYRRDLQEMYTPLKTFIPGSGGGYNKNSYALSADYGLFSPLFGESQARTKLNFTHPIISDFDKFLGLVYVSRLDFSAFLNRGTAWSGSNAPNQNAYKTAHGYNVDLLMDNKGVRFNCGMGVGQVVGSTWQSYATAGFDALF